MASTKVSIIAHSELQHDWTVHTPFTYAHAHDTISLNTDSNDRLNVFYISNDKVMNAYQAPQADGNSLQTWTIEDMNFPSAVNARPVSIQSIRLPTDSDYVVVMCSDNNLYVLDTAARYPIWILLENRTRGSVKPVSIEPFLSTGDMPRIAVICGDSGLYIVNPATGSWRVVDEFSVGVNGVRAAAEFAGSGSESTWGYLISGQVYPDGKNLITGLVISNTDPDTIDVTLVGKGAYTSLAYVPVSTKNASPLIFGIDENQEATYFQADGKGSFTVVHPFGSNVGKVQKVDAVRRSGIGLNNVKREWIELFAADTSGNLWHIESTPPDNVVTPPSLPKQSIIQLADGEYAVQSWRTPAIILSSPTLSFGLSSSSDGYPFLVALSTGANSNGPITRKLRNVGAVSSTTLTTLTQDPVTTDWTATELAVTSTELGDAKERSVYYVELTVMGEDRIQKPGIAANITAVEYAEVDINGTTTIVDSVRAHQTITNDFGKITLTCPVQDDLGCPTFSVWVEGMELNHRVDVMPSGKLRTKFQMITGDDLKAAKDQVDGSATFGDLTDTVRNDVAQSLRDSVKAFGPKAKILTEDDNEPAHKSALAKLYIHPRSSIGLARTRLAGDKTLGHIGGIPGQPFRITFRPSFSFERLTHEEVELHRAQLLRDDKKFTFSWGDMFRMLKRGVQTVFTAVVTPLVDGVKVVLKFADGVWEGIAKYVKQGFDIIAAIFESIKRTFVQIFRWLAYLLDWDDIKTTTAALRKLIVNAVQNGQDCFANTIPNMLNPFFNNAKGWCAEHFDSAINRMNGVEIGAYDTSTTPSLTADDKPSGVEVVDNLPSTATWLMNKVFSGISATGSEDADMSISGLPALVTAWETLRDKAIKDGVPRDFQTALEHIDLFFKTLLTRATVDGKTIGAFLTVCKDALVLLIDIAHTFVDTFLALVAKVFDVFMVVFDTPLNIPILSSIFEALTDQPLTLFNVIITPLAIPMTIAFKVITGRTPFPKESLLLRAIHANQVGLNPVAEKTLTILLGILSVIWTAGDVALDIHVAKTKKARSAGLAPDKLEEKLEKLDKRFKAKILNGFAVLVPMLQLALTAPPLADKEPRVIFSWALSGLTVVVVAGGTIAEDLKYGARHTIPILLSVVGLANLAPPLWHTVNMILGKEPDEPTDRAGLAAEWIAPFSMIAEFLTVVDDPYFIATGCLIVIDVASDVGAGAALFASAATMKDHEDHRFDLLSIEAGGEVDT